MTRESRIDALLIEVNPRGLAEDTNAHHVREKPDRFLLIEENVGSAAASQSHYFTTHATLDEAWEYHDRQEYAEDWSVEFAVDLDTGDAYKPGPTTVEWERV